MSHSCSPIPGSDARDGPWSAALERAKLAFSERFGGAPHGVAAAPGRVNLIGDHTDYNGGFVLPIAIDRYCVAVGSLAPGRATCRVFALDVNQSAEFVVGETPSTIAKGTWASYIAGVVGLMSRRFPALGRDGVDIVVTSDVPFGSGLSSSAALEVSVATLLEALLGVELEPVDKARLCRDAEHEFAGVPCGLMDQLASVCGRRGRAMLIDCRAETLEYIPMPPPERATVVVIDSGVRHALASGEYAARRRCCESAAKKLGVASLRESEAVPTSDSAALSEEEHRCVRHVVSENARTVAAADCLRRGDLKEFGRLMLASHESLRDDYRVSCAELDAIVDSAQGTEGVYGARMTGGGFGGSAIVLAAGPSAAAAANFASTAFVVEAAPGAQRLRQS